MRRHIIASSAIIALSFVVSVSWGQAPSFDRFTNELPRELETDAASALARGQYVEGARLVCARTSAEGAQLVGSAATEWNGRNDDYLKAAGSAVAAFGDRHIPVGGESYRQAYFGMVLRGTASRAVAELRKDFEGATPDNQVVPSDARCNDLVNRLRAGQMDFSKTPQVTRAIEKYMERRALVPK